MKKKTQIILFISICLLSTNFIGISTADNPLEKQTYNTLGGSLAPELGYSPHSHHFGNMMKGEVNTTTFLIWNAGCCTLHYQLSEDEEWIIVNPTSGSSIGEQDPITVTINTADLTYGYYKSNITIIATGGDQNFTVTVNVVSNKIINITVNEAWDLLNDVSNGIQIPIDLREDAEWMAAHINTPYPENPKHHCYCSWNDPNVLQEFLDLYQGTEIILYSTDGDKSTDAANTLVANNFAGLIYKMIGGIDAWIQAGYPTKPNTPPNKTIINGENNGKVGQEYTYTFTATDNDEDKIYYYINWSDSTTNQLYGPYNSGEQITLNHTWSEKGTYTINAQTWDIYFIKSSWSTLEITMPKTSYSILYQILQRLLEKINIYFPFFKY